MALRKNNTESAAATASTKFEAPETGDTAVIEQPTTATAEATVAETATAAAAAPAEAESPTTAVATVAKKELSAIVGKKYAPALEEFKNVIDPSSLQFNTFNRVTVDLGGFEDAEGNDLGETIKIQLMSYNERFVVSPGVQDDDATAFVKYSLDGKTIDGTGESVADYLKMLRETEGYKEASCKKYLAIYGFLTEAKGKEIPEVDRQIVELQVPPMSVAFFTRHQIESGVKISQGIIPATDILVCRREKVDGKSTKYASIKFSSK